ncbi:MAG: glycosyl hydrolase 2 galactose-binding domain-containing protein, partial [bacterium]
MKKVIPLKEGWRLTWRSFRDEHDLENLLKGNTDGWLPASVPGDVHLDLMNAGEGPDPFYGLNADLWRWVEEKDWWYRLDFTPPQISSEQVVHIVFEGIDTFATLYINGRQVKTNKNMFIPVEVDITYQA